MAVAAEVVVGEIAAAGLRVAGVVAAEQFAVAWDSQAELELVVGCSPFRLEMPATGGWGPGVFPVQGVAVVAGLAARNSADWECCSGVPAYRPWACV